MAIRSARDQAALQAAGRRRQPGDRAPGSKPGPRVRERIERPPVRGGHCSVRDAAPQFGAQGQLELLVGPQHRPAQRRRRPVPQRARRAGSQGGRAHSLRPMGISSYVKPRVVCPSREITQSISQRNAIFRSPHAPPHSRKAPPPGRSDRNHPRRTIHRNETIARPAPAAAWYPVKRGSAGAHLGRTPGATTTRSASTTHGYATQYPAGRPLSARRTSRGASAASHRGPTAHPGYNFRHARRDARSAGVPPR